MNNTHHQYADDTFLKKRKALYEYITPKINLDDEVWSLIDLNSTRRILDVGCGNADLLVYLRKEKQFAGELFGIDISPGILASGIAQNEKEQLNINLQVGSIEQCHLPMIFLILLLPNMFCN